MLELPTLTITFTFDRASGMYIATGPEGRPFVVSPLGLHGNLDQRLAVLRDETRAALGVYEPPTRRTPPPYQYDESKVQKVGVVKRAKLEELDIDLEELEL